jgi:membrane-associated protease RseP (regulator of RpoE activity)
MFRGECFHRKNIRAFLQIGAFFLVLGFPLLLAIGPTIGFAQSTNGQMTEEKALALAEEFGVDVGEVDEELRDFLGLTKAEGVVVFAVIGGTPADLAGIKVKSIIKEVDKYEIKTLLDLGRALEVTMPTQNFSVATYEPADPTNQGVSGGLNFHFVRVNKD